MPDDDVDFPSLHVRPREGWVNDPNGLCRIDGTYHAFLQHNPDAPVHGHIQWGHLSSTDLLHWAPEPIALVGRPDGIDADGCWSGSVVDDHGTPTAIYTAVREHATDGVAALATSDRTLRHWSQRDTGVPKPDDPAITEVRDPFVFSAFGHRYVVQGAGSTEPDGEPQLLLWGCDDLEEWTYLGALLTTADPVAAEVAAASIWECPNLFPLGDRWVAIISLLRIGDGNLLDGVRYLVGDLRQDGDAVRFVAESGGVLDEGPAFYAPQTLVDGDRPILFGWSWELRDQPQVDAAGWAGSLTFPRDLRLVDGVLVMEPAAELDRLRGEPLDADGVAGATAFELVGDGPVTLALGATTVVAADVVGTGPVRILVDGSVVEAFGADRAFTTRAYPSAGGGWSFEGTDVSAYALRLPA